MPTVNREILRLAIPNILSNVSVPLISSVDTALMGYEQTGAAYIAAVGLGSMFFNMLYWGFSFLRMGTTGMTAQAFGSQDDALIAGHFGRGMLVALSVATCMILLQWPLEQMGLYLLGADENTAPLVAEYFRIRIWAAPATLGLMVFMGWFFGMQNAIYPLILTLIINISNIFLSVILVQKWGWGIAGTAWGTVWAQYLGLAVAGLFLVYKYGRFRQWMIPSLLKDWEALSQFFQINRDIFFRTICLIAAFGFFYNRSSAMGVVLLALNQVFMQYTYWMAYAVDGFAYAAESLVGKYKGADDEEKVKTAIRLSFLWGGALALMFSLLFYFGDVSLLRIFTDNWDVLSVGQEYQIWIILYPLLGFASYIWDGVFVGLTASKAMRDTMFFSLIAFVLSYGLLQSFGNHGLWLSMLVYVAIRGVLQTFWYKKGWL